MSEAYEDLGGAKAPAAPPQRTNKARHVWRLIDFDSQTSKHQCRHCGTVRTQIIYRSRFPAIKFVDAKGVRSEGRAPPCLRPESPKPP